MSSPSGTNVTNHKIRTRMMHPDEDDETLQMNNTKAVKFEHCNDATYAMTETRSQSFDYMAGMK